MKKDAQTICDFHLLSIDFQGINIQHMKCKKKLCFRMWKIWDTIIILSIDYICIHHVYLIFNTFVTNSYGSKEN